MTLHPCDPFHLVVVFIIDNFIYFSSFRFKAHYVTHFLAANFGSKDTLSLLLAFLELLSDHLYTSYNFAASLCYLSLINDFELFNLAFDTPEFICLLVPLSNYLVWVGIAVYGYGFFDRFHYSFIHFVFLRVLLGVEATSKRTFKINRERSLPAILATGIIATREEDW